MSELDELLKQMEELRLSMVKIKAGKSFTDPEVIAASQVLDAALSRYQVMLMKMKKAADKDLA